MIKFTVQLFLIALVIMAIAAIEMKDLLNSAIVLATFNLTLSFIFYYLHAPDVAIAEAAIGAGAGTAIFVIAISKTERKEK